MDLAPAVTYADLSHSYVAWSEPYLSKSYKNVWSLSEFGV